ncbi:MAG: prolipoprotein diacylglyceryl transferase [Deltaproteobacteria bacterium]|nr:MAG: prolipoprotein diacylglyceryl transferase [Deltaproteobacteria bacterium]
MEGFVWDTDPAILAVGPLQIRYYGLLFASALVIGYYLWQWQMRKAGYDQAVIIIFPYYIGILGIVGARLGHCFFYEPAYFIADPVSIVRIWRGGLSSHGAAVGMLIAIFLYAHIKKIPWHIVLDSNAFVSALIATFMRIGNFINSEIVGRITDLPWCVHFVRFRDEGTYCRHPSQLYEASFGLAILAGLILLDRKLGKKRPPALLAGVFLVSYFLCRFLVEFVKEYQALTSDSSLTMGQYLSIPFFLTGVYLLVYTWRHRNQESPHPSGKKVPAPKTAHQRGKTKSHKRSR